MTRYRFPWRTRLRRFWRRLIGRAIIYWDEWPGEELEETR